MKHMKPGSVFMFSIAIVIPIATAPSLTDCQPFDPAVRNGERMHLARSPTDCGWCDGAGGFAAGMA